MSRRLDHQPATEMDSSSAARDLPAGSSAAEARQVRESELGSPTARGRRAGRSTGESKDSGGRLACGQCRCSTDPRGRIDLMTLDEFLQLVGIARSTFHDWVASSRAPARIKLPNGAIRFRTDEVERWLADRENGGQS